MSEKLTKLSALLKVRAAFEQDEREGMPDLMLGYLDGLKLDSAARLAEGHYGMFTAEEKTAWDAYALLDRE